MPTQVINKTRTLRWEAALLASSLILALVVDAALPAGALDDGAYDTSYGSSGVASVTSGNAKHIAVDSQNRAVVVGGKFVSGSSCAPYIARFTPAGVLDTTFGSGQVGWTEITPAIPCADTDNASVVIGPSDTVFITTHTNTDFGVRKFTSAGIPDPTWGTNGLVTTDFGADEYPRAAALSGTDLIVVGKSYDGTLWASYDKPAAALYGPTGQLVSTFGTQGKVKIDVSSVADSEWFDDVAVYNDGKFTIAGTYGANNTDPGGNRLPFVVRLNTDGSPDPTFNPTGSAPDSVAGIRLVTEAEVPSGCRCAGERLVVLDAANSSTSRIAIAGSHRDPSTSVDTIYVEEFNADGSLNTAFGTNGVTKLNVPNSKAAYVGGIVLDGSNLVIAGRPITNDANFMARLDAATGAFDTTFVVSGSTLGWSLGTVGPAFDLAIDNYGRYLVAAASPDATITPSQILAYYGTYDVPDVPTGLAAAAGDGQVVLSWSAPANTGGVSITDYVVEYSSDGGSSWSTFADGTSASTGATVTGLTNGTPYQFRVSATNSAGTGTVSSTTNATPVTVAGAPMIGAVSSVTATSVSVSWTAPSDDGGATITDYKIEYSSDDGSSWSTFAHSASTVSPAVVNGLSPATAYTFKVAAHNSAGNGTASGTVAATTSAAVPGVPTGLAGTAGNTEVTLSWSAPSDDGGSAVTDYKIEYSPDPGSTWSTFANGTLSSTGATVTGLTNGTPYTFRVSATNSAGTGTVSSTTNATPAAPPPAPPTVSVPGSPSGVAGSAGDSQVVVSWAAPSSTGGSGIIGYTVTASPGGATCVSQTISCTVSGLTNGTAYTFTVHATNIAGDSAEAVQSSSVSPVAAVDPAPGLAGCPTRVPTPFGRIAGSFAETDIGCIRSLGITSGTRATTFDPAAVLTREQMAAYLARTLRSLGGTCQVGVVTPFTDTAGSFAETDIGCIRSLGITTGTSATTFDPTGVVTREQIVTFLARLWRSLGGTCQSGVVTPFTDIGGSFAEADIGCIRSLGITTGTSATTFDPTGVVTLEQMAAFLARTIRAFAL